MFTKKLEDQFSADLLNTVRGVLDEAKKCPEDCECEKCEDKEEDDEDEMKEGFVSAAQRKAVWANRADDGKGHPGKKKKMKESNDDVPFEGPYKKAGERKDEYGNKVKNVAKHLAKKAMKAQKNEEVSLDEENDEGWYTHSQLYGSKKSEKHPKGISAAEWKSGIRWHHGKNKRINIKEEAEQIDEEPTDPNYHAKVHQDLQWHAARNKGRHMGAANYNYLASLDNQSHIENHYEKTVLPILKKHGYPAPPEGPGAGGNQKYHDAVQETIKNWKNERRVSDVDESTKVDEAFEQIDELSKATMGRYINKAATKMGSQGVTAGLKIAADEKSSKNFKDMAKREKGIKLAVSKLTKEEQDFIDALNVDTLEEGRGRPPKEGSPAWHAKQKQANDDMVALGMQLRKAKSINKKVRFMDNKEHEISSNHIGRFEDHMAARRTTQEKDNFQRQAHKSHADFVKAVSAPVPKAAKDTGEIVKYR